MRCQQKRIYGRTRTPGPSHSGALGALALGCDLERPHPRSGQPRAIAADRHHHSAPNFNSARTSSFKTEQGVEVNTLLHVTPCLMAQPVLQYFANVGGGGTDLLIGMIPHHSFDSRRDSRASDLVVNSTLAWDIDSTVGFLDKWPGT